MELRAAVDELVGLDPAALDVVELDREISRLQAVRAQAAAAHDAGQAWVVSGARTAAHWFAFRCHAPLEDTRRWVRLGHRMRTMPATAEAWADGRISERHVAKLSAANRPRTAEVFARDEAQLVGYAGTLTFNHFCRAVEYWLQLADPDGVESDAERENALRSAHLDQSFQGTWFGKLRFDAVRGTIVDEALRAIYDELFKADWAEARERLGRDPLVTELRRTPAQRRADAFVEMAARSRAMPKGARKPRPLFTVHVGYETLKGRICELSNRMVVTPGSLAPYLTEADIERVVFGADGRVVDVGQRRCFTGATRRAVEVAGQECFHETCEEPAERSQVDHIEPAEWGGPTETWNGRPACAFHNRWRTRAP